MNRYSLWRYILLVALVVLGVLYALPNIYGVDPAVQISNRNAQAFSTTMLPHIKQFMQQQKIITKSIDQEKNIIELRFANTTVQLKAQTLLKAELGDKYVVAVNLASRTPQWLESLGGQPMKLGLDLQGGIHFLLAVDIDSMMKARARSDLHGFSSAMREKMVRYSGISLQGSHTLSVRFRDSNARQQAMQILRKNYPDYTFTSTQKNGQYLLNASLESASLTKIANDAVDQNITTLNKRINELGVAEATVQRQGSDHIAVDLPGVQDAARAKDLLGKMATVEFNLVDGDHDAEAVAQGEAPVPFGDRLLKDESGSPVLVKAVPILTGDSIVSAATSMGDDGRPAVSIRLAGSVLRFNTITSQNIGKPLASIYKEIRTENKMVKGKLVQVQTTSEKIISIATIQSALGNQFQITGLNSQSYAANLALLLRSGSLSAGMTIVQNQIVGPSLGRSNIEKGVYSTMIGSLVVILFMALYYRVFGLVADMALLLNIIFIIAIQSLIGVTLTLPGIAAIVLTVGMAVDANVLINERIREELRLGLSPQASIHAGYERAFTTIVDANVTTLIVALVLFSLGTGSVKGFAVTLIIGLLTSMVTAIFFTRAVINLVYGSKRHLKNLSIGIHLSKLSRSQQKMEL